MKRLVLAILLSASAVVAANPITIYTSRKDFMTEPVMSEYTKETGVQFQVIRNGENELIERLRAEGRRTPADLFWTQDSASLQLASDLKMLSPLPATITSLVGKDLHSAKNDWVAFSVRSRPIIYNPTLISRSELSTYEDLADPKWASKLCLRTSKKVYNQTMIATFMRNYGMKETTRIVKGWVSNLARAPYNDDTIIVDEVSKGNCAVGIVNAHYYFGYLSKNPDAKVGLFFPNQNTTGAHVNITGVGVLSASANKAEVQKFIQWMLTKKAQELYVNSTKEFPVLTGVRMAPSVEAVANFKRDRLLLDDSQLVKATMLMDAAGYR